MMAVTMLEARRLQQRKMALDLTRNYREHSDMTAQELTSQITTEWNLLCTHNHVFCSHRTRGTAIFQTVYVVNSDYTEPPHRSSISVVRDTQSGVTEAAIGPLICSSFQRGSRFGWGQTWRRLSKILWLVINSSLLMFGHLSATFLFWRRMCLFEVGFFFPEHLGVIKWRLLTLRLQWAAKPTTL